MDIVATVTASAALLTGLANFFMIMEMKKQRTATSKPVLKVLTKNRSATIPKGSKTWTWDDSESSHFTKLSLMNFGTGPALNVTASWDVDLEGLLNVLRYFDPYKQMDFGHEKGFVKLDDSFHAIHNQKEASIDAIPVNGTIDSQELKVPSYYISAFEKYVELGVLNRPKTNAKTPEAIELPDFPEIYVILNYEEINGIKLEQKFKVLLSFSSVSSVESEDKNEVNATFNVKEVG